MNSLEESPRKLHLRMLDTSLRIVTDSPGLAARIERELGSFRTEGGGETEVQVRFSPPPPRAWTSRGAVELSPEDAEEQAFGLIFREALDHTRSFVVLHAAALEKEGRVLLVAGPSEAGKTTLALALVARGFRILSDDYTPLHRESGLVHPFLKALGVRPGPGRRLASLGESEDMPYRALVDAERLGSTGTAPRPGRPAAVVLLDGGDSPLDPRADFLFALRSAGDEGGLAEHLSAESSLELVAREDDGVVLRVPGGSSEAVTAIETAIERFERHILEYGLVPRSYERRRTAPRLLDMPRLDALLLLLRDAQNRRPGSALLRELNGHPAPLLMELASHLGQVPLRWLVPGPPEESAEALEAFFDQSLSSSTSPGSTSSS